MSVIRRFRVTLDCEGQKANFWFGDKASVEAELQRLDERRDDLRSQGCQDEAIYEHVHELWCHITTHFDWYSRT